MKGLVVWITGLPSAGKSALAHRVWHKLCQENHPACVLDGDAVRDVMHPTPGYDPASRDAFYATLGGLAALLARQGLVVIVAATAHRRAYRDNARSMAPRFAEIYVNVPLEQCAQRDAKGLYAAARDGQPSHLPGIDVEYEAPEAPDVVALGGYDDEAVTKILRVIH